MALDCTEVPHPGFTPKSPGISQAGKLVSLNGERDRGLTTMLFWKFMARVWPKCRTRQTLGFLVLTYLQTLDIIPTQYNSEEFISFL